MTSLSTRHLVDPDLLPTLDQMPEFGTLDEQSLSVFRDMDWGQPDAALQPTEKIIDGPDGPISVFWFDPSPGGRDRPALLYIHGGGMVLGSARTITDLPARIAATLNLPVASVDYRLAPETPFPGPQEDCYDALTWLAGMAGELGVDPARIGVIGQSAGGGLAAAVAQMSRDRAGPALAAQILCYPMLDHRSGSDADVWRNPHTGEFLWTRANNRFGWQSLRGDYVPDDARKGWFSPSLAEDLSNLPPAWIGVGSIDLFFDEDLDYARRLLTAGVQVELHAYPGGYHGFDLVQDAPLTKTFTRDMLDGVRRFMRLPS